jgi:hypothetical protein
MLHDEGLEGYPKVQTMGQIDLDKSISQTDIDFEMVDNYLSKSYRKDRASP